MRFINRTYPKTCRIIIFAFLLAILITIGMISSPNNLQTLAQTAATPTIKPQQSRTGPVPPPEVLRHDALKPPDRPEDIQSEVTLPVPAYKWRHGCLPTAVGMIVGYYDMLGYDDLIPGSAATQTDAVNQAIASGGDSSNPNPPGYERHYEDYASPEDAYPNLLDDAYITAGRTPHQDDCLADYMDTSKSTRHNYYGWSWSSDVAPGFIAYVNQQNPNYSPSTEFYDTNTLTWSVLTREIDAGRPMVFLVDSNGDGNTDHFVPVIGYRTSPTNQYGSWDTWSTDTIRWENFAPMARGVPWGIWGGWSFSLRPLREVVDVALIIDSSGSMSWNDPSDLRKEAAKVFVDTMQESDQVAIVDFDDGTRVPWHLALVDNNRPAIKAAIDTIDSDGGTNIGAGLQTGYDELNSSTKDNKKAAVLLTDGQGDYNNEATLYANKGWPVYTIGLSDDADEQLLQQIANDTGGRYFQLSDPNDLAGVYFEIATEVAEGTVIINVSKTMTPGSTWVQPVNGIASGVQSLFFLVNWPGSEVSTELIRPDGVRIDPSTTDPNVYHAKGLTYELYRVDNPLPGDWTVEIFGTDLAPEGELVTLQVSEITPSGEPEIEVAPSLFDLSLPVGSVTSKNLTIRNVGGSDLNWEMGEESTTHKPTIQANNGDYPRGEAPPTITRAPNNPHGNHATATEQDFVDITNDGAPAYGINLLDEEFVSFTTDDATNLSIISPANGDFYAGDFIDGDFSTLYVVDNADQTLYRMDTSTGALQSIGPMTANAGQAWTGMAGDPVTGKMYAVSTDCTDNTLYTVDLTTGSTTIIGTSSGYCIIDIAINSAGELYGVDIITDQLISIDKTTGAVTPIGSLGFDANYAQDMDFDEKTDILYLAAYNNVTYEAELRIADVNTGATTLIGPIGAGDGVELDAFAIATTRTGCYGDIPWLTMSPTTGTTLPGSSSTVDITFDATNLAIGNYSGEICVSSNDSANPLVRIPVELEVIGGGVDIYLEPPSSSTYVGSIFTLDIMADAGVQPINNVELYLNFDPAFLQVVDVSGNPASAIEPDPNALNTVLLNSVDNTNGLIRYDAGRLSGTPPSGTFRIATIRFKALDESSQTSVRFDPSTDAFYNGASVIGSTQDASVEIQPGCLEGSVTLQAHATSDGYPIVLSLFNPGDSTPIASYNTTLDANGNFSICGLAGGPFDVSVKGNHSLSSKRTNLTIPATAPVDFCTLLEGDASNDDRISGIDFSILASAYNTQNGDSTFDPRADFNDDGRISGVDFSLLASNYNLSGPILCTPPLAPSAPTGLVDLAFHPITQTADLNDILTFDLLADAADQPLNNVELYIHFDPSYLQVVDGSGDPAFSIQPDLTTLNTVLFNSVDNSQGLIRYDAGKLAGDPPTGAFRIATIQFKLIETPQETTTISYLPQSDVFFNGASVVGRLGSAVIQSEASNGCIYDFNNDGFIDIDDINIAIEHSIFNNAPYDPTYDVVPDGIIDIADIFAVASHFGQTCP